MVSLIRVVNYVSHLKAELIYRARQFIPLGNVHIVS